MALKRWLKQAMAMAKNSWYVYFMEKYPIAEKTILLESQKGGEIGSNILRILEELSSENYQEYQIFLALEKKVALRGRKLLEHYGIHRVRIVDCNGLHYFRLLATARYLINDTSFPKRFVKREGQKYLNTWHGTSFKKLGKDIPQGAYAIGNVQRNLLMADVLAAPSRAAMERLVEAHNLLNLYQGMYVYTGYARNQVFFQPERREKLRQDMQVQGKKIYCYMPTWRGSIADHYDQRDREEQIQEATRYLDLIDQTLTGEEILFLRLHPYVGQKISCEKYQHIRPFPREYDPYEILDLSDCLITDYSSVFFDYANRREGKTILFLYDRDSFQEERDYYDQPEEFPFPVAKNAEELLREMRSPKEYDDEGFRKKYCPYDGPEAAKKLCRFFLYGEETEYLEKEPARQDEKKNLLFYVGGLKRNGMTTSFLNLMENMNQEDYHYYAAFQENYLEEEPWRLDVLPDFIKAVPMTVGWNLTWMEAVSAFLYYKWDVDHSWIQKYMKRFYQREYRRDFGYARFDWCIHFNGYEKKVIRMFQEAPGKRAIFVHNDMLMEIQTKGNQHLKTLEQAYRSYDVVATVTQDIYDRTLEISHKKENLYVVNNCHAYIQVLERAEEPLLFDESTRCTVTRERLEEILQSPVKKFITIGRFSPEKGHFMLLDAFKHYQESNPNSMLIIVGGSGELYEKTWEHVENLDLKEKVVLLKSVKNPMPILKACDLFILSSLYEGLGLVILEADTLGIPVIATDVTGPRGFMREHGGMLVPPTAEGLEGGMEAFDRGEVPIMHVDYEAYNKKAVKEFQELL